MPQPPTSLSDFPSIEAWRPALLAALPAGASAVADAPLSAYTRFGIGGPAAVLVDTVTPEALAAVVALVRKAPAPPWIVLGGGTNLVVADSGFPGVVLRYRADRIDADGPRVFVESGALLQHLVDFTVERSLARLHTMTGIPGWAGGALYGNAGAYGHAINESVRRVRFWDGSGIRSFSNAECGFEYRESVFKRRKDWILLDAELELEPGDGPTLAARAAEILRIRNEKYPPEMKCAGSIFKNLFFASLPAAAREAVPAQLVREGKVPSAFFLEQVGAKGTRLGGVTVADYHANLIYNEGSGSAAQVRELVADLKGRVLRRFALELEEEVQYVGFDAPAAP